MDIRDLGRLDLNLLVALEALLEEGNVSRAAQRVFVTQSAMSKTLGRLRDLFDDPLFIRRGATMVPTPRAEQLAMQLPKLLRSIQDMLAPPNFDPLVYEGEFNLLVQGHMGVWLLPRLMERLSESAPHIRLGTLSYLERAHEEDDEGGVLLHLLDQLMDPGTAMHGHQVDRDGNAEQQRDDALVAVRLPEMGRHER
jgi:DNA-binding transcriptional LysR family regulator